MDVRWTRRLYRWHKWTGLVTGLFIALLSVSGCVLVFREELDCVLTPGRRIQEGVQRLPLDRLIAATASQYPGARVEGLQLQTAPGRADTVFLSHAKTFRQVFVDPYTGAVTGERKGDGVANVIRVIHIRFYFFGWQGRLAVGLFGVTMLASCLSGLLIYGPFLRGVHKQGLRFFERRGGRQLSLSDWHKLIGVCSLAFHLLIGTTGAVLGAEAVVRIPPHSPRPIRGEQPLVLTSADEALGMALTALPGFRPAAVIVPSPGSPRYTIYGGVRSASFVNIDGRTGRVAETYEAPAAGYGLIRILHFADYGGFPVRLLYALLGLSGAVLPLTGWLLNWWKRYHSRA